MSPPRRRGPPAVAPPALGAARARRLAGRHRGAGAYSWAAATVGSNSAAGYQLATDRPVMAIGKFNGTDPAPSLARFQEYVGAGRIHYFIGGSMTRGPGGDVSSQITAWVTQNFAARTVGGATVYDLST